MIEVVAALYPVYTIKQSSSKHRADIEQTSISLNLLTCIN